MKLKPDTKSREVCTGIHSPERGPEREPVETWLFYTANFETSHI